MKANGPVLPALSFPNPSSKGAVLLVAACPFCERQHHHGDPHRLPVGAITHRGAHCINASVSPLCGHGYSLQIVKICAANDVDTLVPHRGSRKPLHARLAKLAPRLRRETLRVIIPQKPNGFGTVETGAGLKLTANHRGQWRLIDVREATGPAWEAKLIANGEDFASLVAFLTGSTIEVVIAAFVRSLHFDADAEFFNDVAGILHRWWCRLAADGTAAPRGQSGYATCFDRPADIGHYVGNIIDCVVHVFTAGERHSDLQRDCAEAFLGEHLARTYDLPAGVVAYRLIEAVWAVKFDWIAAAEFMHLPNSLPAGGPGVGERIRRMFSRPQMTAAVNDNLHADAAAEIGGGGEA